MILLKMNDMGMWSGMGMNTSVYDVVANQIDLLEYLGSIASILGCHERCRKSRHGVNRQKFKIKQTDRFKLVQVESSSDLSC